jgi:hypothetical protein
MTPLLPKWTPVLVSFPGKTDKYFGYYLGPLPMTGEHRVVTEKRSKAPGWCVDASQIEEFKK